MVSAGCSSPSKRICLLPTGGSHVGGFDDQRVEGGGLAGKEAQQQERSQRWRQKGRERSSIQQRSVTPELPSERASRCLRNSKHGSFNPPKPSSECPNHLLGWAMWMVEILFWSSLPLGRYAQSTMNGDPPKTSERASENLYPCPPPFPWDTFKRYQFSRSRRRQRRFARRRSIELLTNFMTVALSHQALGCSVCPERGRCGTVLNHEQQKMVEHLIIFARSVCCHGESASGCGMRLPCTQDRLKGLRKKFESFADLAYGVPAPCVDRSAAVNSTVALPVIASRLSLPETLQDFNPMPYLSSQFRALYQDPNQFLLPEDQMPPRLKVRGTASRFKVFERWDRLGRLFLATPQEIAVEDSCAIFSVARDQEVDRQIIHRKPRNIREVHVPGESRNLPHAVLLCQLPLERIFDALGSVDDIKNFYHAFRASDARARSTPIGGPLRSSCFRHLRAFKEGLNWGRFKEGDLVVPCFRGLAMEDHAAVDIAQEAHTNLLRHFGTMRSEEVMNYRKPLPCPKSRFYEGIMIDDHLGVQLVPRATPPERSQEKMRDEEVFQSAQQAYASEGLEPHEKKRVRRSDHFLAWGAELEGRVGLVGPSRTRLFALMRLTSELAMPGAVEQKVVQRLTGLWAFCCQFRRPMLAFMNAIYHQQPPEHARIFKLSREARNELLVLACLGPCCLTDLRAVPCNDLFCVDASPSGAGVCRAHVGKNVSRECWRRGDKMGYRAPMLSKLGAALKGSGWDEDQVFSFLDDDAEEDLIQEVSEPESCIIEGLYLGIVPRPITEEPWDFVEVYAGCSEMTRVWKKAGFRTLNPIERNMGLDMCDEKVFHGLLQLCLAKKIRMVWWAPPCTTFSLARCPKLRNQEFPWGFDVFNYLVAVGNLHAVQSFLIAWIQFLVHHFFAGEQPAFGFMRFLGPWKHFVSLGCFETLFDWCRFGRHFKKRTRLLHNCTFLKPLGLLCCHKKKHVKLEGQRTTLAGAYNQTFCDRVAELCKNAWSIFELHEEVLDACEKFDVPVVRKHVIRSHLWSVQLSECLSWKTCLQYRFRKLDHINLQEGKARRSLFKMLPHSIRVAIFQDSRVSIGALGRGRSPSQALNLVLRTEAPYILGKNIYPSSLHCPT